MSSSNTAYVDRTSDSSRIWMDVTDPHVIGAGAYCLRQFHSAATSIAQAISWHWPMRRSRFSLKRAEREETPSSLTINGQSMITVSSQSGDTTGTLWEAVTECQRFEQRQRSEFRDRRVRAIHRAIR